MFYDSDPEVAKHDDRPIRFNAGAGVFWIKVPDTDGDTKTIKDKTLDGLKKKLETSGRAEAIAKAADAPILAVTVSRWEADADFVEGTFAGINAHTGQVTIDVGGKKKQIETRSETFFFRRDDPSVKTLRELIKDWAKHRKAEQAALKVLHDHATRHGFKLSDGYVPSRDKVNSAMRREQAMVTFLSGGPGAAAK